MPPLYIAESVESAGEFIEKHEGFFNAVSTAFIAIFTIVLANKTAGLFTETFKLRAAADQQDLRMQESLHIAKIAAETARESADALVAVERGFVVEIISASNLNPTVYCETAEQKDIYEVYVSVPFFLKNYGKTPTIIRGVFVDVFLASSPRFLETKDVAMVAEPFPVAEDTLATLENIGPHTVSRTFAATKETVDDWKKGVKPVYLNGIVVFEDVFGKKWEREFIWEYLSGYGRFRRAHGETHPYVAKA